MSLPKIIIKLADGGYMADFSQSSIAEDTQRLFNTMILPTPFLAGCPYQLVVATIENLNPGNIVLFEA